MLITINTQAQVIIKEKVEISPSFPVGPENPIITFPDSIYSGSSERLSTNQTSYQPENLQSTITLTDGGRVFVQVIYSEAAGSAKIDLLIRQPNQQTILEYANKNVGYSCTTEEYPPGTNVEFGIYWYWNNWGTIYEGNEAGAVITQISSSSYRIGFEAAGDDWDYNELVIYVNITDEPDFDVSISPEQITGGEWALLEIMIANYCNMPPTQLNVEIIQGQEYGSLIDPYTYESVKSITGLDYWGGYAWVDYISDGVSVAETEQVVIRVSTTDSMTEPKEVILYINPPPIYVYTIPEVVGVADTALIIIKKRNPDGTLEDFPAEQLFEVAATEGCINGNILVGDSLGVYFSAAQQPIYFVAADSIEGDSGYVRLRVGTDIETISIKPVTVNEHIYQKRKQNDLQITELREGYKQMLEDKRQLLNKNEAEKKEEELTEGLIVEACFTGFFSEIGYWQGDVLVKKDGCDEEIVVCESSLSQSVDTLSFNLLRSNVLWTWFDRDGVPQAANVLDVCVYHQGSDHPLGITKFLYKIPGIVKDYYFLDDLVIKSCLDQSDDTNQNWNFNIENLRIPIISDYCFDPTLIDLYDGSNTSILSANISDCKTYKEVIDLLDWFIVGPYSQQDDILASNFVWSSGVRKHEDKHFFDKRTHIKNDLDTIAFKEIRKIYRGIVDFPCPEDALDISAKARIKAEIRKGVNRGQNIKKIMGDQEIVTLRGNKFIVPKSELEADRFASELYQTIKKNIYNWAKQQSWYINTENCEQ